MLDVDRTRLVALSFTLAVLAAPLVAEPAGYNELAAAQAAANAQPDQGRATCSSATQCARTGNCAAQGWRRTSTSMKGCHTRNTPPA